ncbi:juvenile hormone acid O-methyltransferase-like isoform X2 [Pseudomyrmex gracilis]|uniref:juvenile hormone acid O-methyltransferase-like isoform X2 n=1 Tax=Pseudomyrmex gracilis TaxID=219809 RepID=UPI0009950430|nr:juvenile hormone acid O-methyltransferase-like isoform X2 [Pseudomyrmex gracilis]
MDPEKYVVHNVVQSTITQSIIKICEQEMPNNIFSGKCMHVGCGPGNTTMSLLLPNLHPHATLIGTDIDEDMIEFANKNYRVERHLTFEVMDIQTKRLPDKYVCEFNHIFSFNTLQWCTDIQQAFVNIYHMLRSNGSALFYFEIKSDVPSILETLATDNRFAPYSQELSDVYLYSKPVSFFALGITKFLASIGFSIDTYNVEGFTIYGYEHFESVLATTLSSMSPLIHKLPIHLREKFRNQFASNFKKKYVHSSKKNSLKNNINTTILIVHVFKLPQLRYKFLLTSNEIPPNALVSNISLNEAHQENVHSVIEMYAKVLRYMTGKCMNISCGLGDVTNLLVSALDPNATLIGIDTSKSVIECARQLNKNERLTFEVLNIETKVLPEKYVSQFEHIFSFCALQQCKDIRFLYQ